jgi:hypothetical protein
MTQNLVNMTPHPITIVDAFNQVVLVIPFSGNQIRLKAETIVLEETVFGVPLSKTVFSEPVGLPDYSEGTYYIVSQLVKSALPLRTDLLVPAEVVRDTTGNIIGCRSLGM